MMAAATVSLALCFSEGRLTHIGKPARWQGHRDRTHQRAGHDEQVRVRIVHADADLADEREDDERGDGVGDEGGHDQDQGGEDDQHAVEAEVLDAVGDGVGDGV